MSPKISIIVPIYNVEKYLPKCIESILNQSFEDFELILINDGSKDNCSKICKEYAKKDSRIIIINKENTGVSDSRNKGIEIAKGEYIGFVDSDDYINPYMYEELINSCINNNSDISIIGFTGIDKTGKELFTYIPNENSYKLSEILKAANPVNKLYKKKLFKDDGLRYKVNRFYEDLNLIPKLIIKADKISFVGKSTYYYLQREGSTTHSKDDKILDNLWAYVDIKDYLECKNLYKEYEYEFMEGVNYFKLFYANILYTYPFSFIFKNRKFICENFNKITTLHIYDYIYFILKYIKIKIMYKNNK